MHRTIIIIAELCFTTSLPNGHVVAIFTGSEIIMIFSFCTRELVTFLTGKMAHVHMHRTDPVLAPFVHHFSPFAHRFNPYWDHFDNGNGLRIEVLVLFRLSQMH